MSEPEIICEINGVPVLTRTEGGELEAPEGLEGLAAYFESGGIPEKVYGGEGGGELADARDYRDPPDGISEWEWALAWIESHKANRLHPDTGRTAKEVLRERLPDREKCEHPNPVTDSGPVEWCPACGSVIQVEDSVVTPRVQAERRQNRERGRAVASLERIVGNGPLGTDVRVAITGTGTRWEVSIRQKVEHGRQQILAGGQGYNLPAAVWRALEDTDIPLSGP